MNRWTDYQINFLKENYGTLYTAKECAVFLDKSKSAVSTKASYLGLKSARNKLLTPTEYMNKLVPRLITPLEDYKGSHISIKHKCAIDGNIWVAKPYSIISGKGCPICAKKKLTKTHEQYINESPYKVIESYVNSATRILHECPRGHQWKASPNRILAGHGCPSCANYTFKLNIPSILYYLKIETNNSEIYYKIGVTNRSIKERFSSEKSSNKITILFDVKFDTGIEAKEVEQSILEEFKEYRLKNIEVLTSGGNTELFEFDILGFDI